MNNFFQKLFQKLDKGFLKAVFGAGSTRIAGLAFGFVFFGLVANQFGAEVMGRFAIAITILSILSTLCSLGFVTSLIRFISGDLEKNNQQLADARFLWVLKFTGFLGLASGVFMMASSNLVADIIFDDPKLTPFLILASLAMVPYGANNILTSYHQAHDRIALSSSLRFVFIPFSASLMLFVLPFFGVGDSLPMLAHILGITICCCIGGVYYFFYNKSDDFGVVTYKTLDDEQKTEMFKVSLPLLMAGISGMLLGWADTLMLGVMTDSATTGLYAVVFRFGVFVALPYQIVGWVILSKLAAAYEAGDKSMQQKWLSMSVHFSITGALPLVLAFCLFGEQILYLFGEEFQAAYWILVVIVLGEFIGLFFGYAVTVMTMGKMQMQYQNILIMSVIFNVALNFFLIPIYGAMGAAVATVFTHIVKQGMMSWMVYKRYGLIAIGVASYLKGKSAPKAV